MTPLRQRMIKDVQIRNLTPETQHSYIHHVAGFAQYFGRSTKELAPHPTPLQATPAARPTLRVCLRVFRLAAATAAAGH